MSIRPLSAPARPPPSNRLDVALLPVLFHRCVSIDGTGKRKIDGEYAETRLGKSVTLKWANERFRQTMLLIHEFRANWDRGKLLSNDDVEFVRVCLDVALSYAVRQGHAASDYDMSPTVWACWLVQHVLSVRSGGGWQVESVQQQTRWSFAELYHFLQAMHARGDRLKIRDPLTRQVLHRYKLPFKGGMNVPPKSTHLFRWRRGARQLSDWMVAGGLPPLHAGIIEQSAPTVVPPPQFASRRAEVANAMWRRIGQRSGQYELQSLGQGGAGGDPDAEETRQIVRGIMGESRAAAASDDQPQGQSDEAAEDMERELELELEAQQQQQQQQPAEGEADERPIEVMAERVDPPPPQQSEPLAPNQLVWHISQLLTEMHERGEAPQLGELSPRRQQVLNELRDELGVPSASGTGPSAAGPSGPTAPSQPDDEAGLSEYERQRKRNIARNQRVLEELGLGGGGGGGRLTATGPRGGGGGRGRRRSPSAGGSTAPSRRSTRDRGAVAPSYADVVNSSDSDDADDANAD